MKYFKEIPNFCDNKEINLLENFLKDNTNDLNQKFEITNENKDDFPQLKTIFPKIVHSTKDLLEKTFNFNIRFQKAWFQLNKDTSPKSFSRGSPFNPHLDQQRFVKAMLYLSKVTHEDGPFKIADLNPDNYEIIRRELIKKPYANDKILNKYMSSLSEKDFKPIIGKKGHLVLFDTNTPHVAGIPEIGRTRKTLRLDFICDAWAMPKNSIAQRAVNKIFSLYN